MIARIVRDDSVEVLTNDAAIRAAIAEGLNVWIQLEKQCAEEDALLTQVLDIHPLTVEDIWLDRTSPRAERRSISTKPKLGSRAAEPVERTSASCTMEGRCVAILYARARHPREIANEMGAIDTARRGISLAPMGRVSSW